MRLTSALTLAATIIALPGVASAQALPTDREILLELFRATDGPNWKRNAGWGSDAPVCSWDGVWCFRDSRIDALQLWDNNLRGTLPESLTRLAGLKTLNVSGNKLTGTILTPTRSTSRSQATCSRNRS